MAQSSYLRNGSRQPLRIWAFENAVESHRAGMKKKQFESLCKKLLPDLPGFACKGWLLHRLPVSHLLRGFCCNAGAFDPAKFTVHCFVLPLYVPTNHIYFLFGDTLKDDRGCEMRWDVNAVNLADDLLFRVKTQGVPFLTRIDSPTRLVETAQELPSTQETYKWEAIAYSLAMADDYIGAQRALERLAMALDINISWQAEMMKRAKQLGQKLDSDPQGAKQLLTQWEETTLKNLGL